MAGRGVKPPLARANSKNEDESIYKFADPGLKPGVLPRVKTYDVQPPGPSNSGSSEPTQLPILARKASHVDSTQVCMGVRRHTHTRTCTHDSHLVPHSCCNQKGAASHDAPSLLLAIPLPGILHCCVSPDCAQHPAVQQANSQTVLRASCIVCIRCSMQAHGQSRP